MKAGLANLVAVLRGLGPMRLAALAGVGVATLTLLAWLALRGADAPMALLYGELDERDAGQVVAALERARVPYRLGRRGTEVMVPEEQVPRLRLQLAREGIPAGGSVGYEIFDRQGMLSATPFQQDLNRLRALEGEIARSIRSIQGVASARVHLVLPRREPFSRERGEAQASVVLQMRGSQRLDREGVQATLHLIAAAVPGLRPQAVSIVDSRGELLARGGQALPGTAEGQALTVEEMRRAQEMRIARGIEEMLERSLGVGRVRVEATVEFDNERVQVTEERFDPDNQVPRSTQSLTESSRNGEPQNVSVANQLPGAPTTQNGGPTSQESKQEETTNFEIGRTTRTTLRDQPVLRRVSVAVMVDGVVEPPEGGGAPRYRERSTQELERVAALVRGAIGFDQRRGDRIEVVSLRFADTMAGSTGDEGSAIVAALLSPAMVTRLVESALVTLVAILAILFLGRPVVRRVTATLAPAGGLDLDMADGASGALPGPGGGAALAAGGTAATGVLAAGGGLPSEETEEFVDVAMVAGQLRASSLQRVAELVDKNPDEALALVRRWLAVEEKS